LDVDAVREGVLVPVLDADDVRESVLVPVLDVDAVRESVLVPVLDVDAVREGVLVPVLDADDVREGVLVPVLDVDVTSEPVVVSVYTSAKLSELEPTTNNRCETGSTHSPQGAATFALYEMGAEVQSATPVPITVYTIIVARSKRRTTWLLRSVMYNDCSNLSRTTP
jgi:hypothetical protein